MDGKPVGQHPIIVCLLKGIFNNKPSLPRFTATWNVDTNLTYLKTLHPVWELSLKLLTLKLNALLALISARGAQTLVALDTAFMTIQPNKIIFVVATLLKTSRPNKTPLQLTLCRFPETASLCPYLTFQEYLRRTISSRVTATSKAVSQGVSFELILKTADLSTETLFTRFYRRDSIAYEECFFSVVLTS
jgi:hypothetical protein